MRYMNIIERQVDKDNTDVDDITSKVEYFMEKYDVLLQHVFFNPLEPYEDVWDVIDDDYGMHYKAMIVKINNKNSDIAVVEMIVD